MLGSAQMLFGFCAMSGHIVMIGGAGAIHFLHRFKHMVVSPFEIGPIVHFLGHCDSSCEG